MSTEILPAVAALNQRFLVDYPHEAARQLESLPGEEAAALLATASPFAAARTWQALAPDVAAATLEALPPALAAHVLAEAEPAIAVAALSQLEVPVGKRLLDSLDPQVAAELRALLEYPADSAGRLMDPQVSPVRIDATVGEALARLRNLKRKGLREMYLIDEEGRLAVSEDEAPLRELARPVIAVAKDLDPREEVVSILQQQPITSLPVVNISGRLVGVIRQAALVSVIEQEATVDLLTMVGASAEERALSNPLFAVKKRLPWLQINLLTAFLAAAVVGMFEGLIAKFTALAVLLPVVAGQSGNAGAQALAVTMRGLVLREISLRHWPRVVAKEAATGLVNGLAIAATTSLGVYVWSQSAGLAMVIAISMVISMLMAGLDGALVPITLHRLGQDPATASSIILTTITDVVGFFSFLGTALFFSSMLPT